MMSKKESVVTNTLAFAFPDNAAQPTLMEMVRFVKGLTGDHRKMDTAYKNAEERTVYIKYKTEEDMKEALSKNQKKQKFHYSNGINVDVYMSVAGSNTQYIRIFDLPPEVSDFDLCTELTQYGKIKRCIREKYPPEFQLNLYTGVRGVYMDVEKEIPSVIYIHSRRGRVFYTGNKLKCFSCGQEGHHKNACELRKTNETRNAEATVQNKETAKNNTFAAVLVGTSSSDNNRPAVDISGEVEAPTTTLEVELDNAKQQNKRQNQQQLVPWVLHYQQHKQPRVGNWTEYVQMHSKLRKQQQKQQKCPNSSRAGTE